MRIKIELFDNVPVLETDNEYATEEDGPICGMDCFVSAKLYEIVKKYVATNDEDGLAKEIAGMQFEAREY